MMDPLMKRLPREFKSDFGKYAVIFLFMIMLISLVSGFIVADNSLVTAYNESFEKYNTEHGHITFDKEPSEELISRIEKNGGIELYDLRYCDEAIDGTGSVTRVYIRRDIVNRECLLEGAMPETADEIAIDRVFAKNNKIKVGDKLSIRGNELTVSGFVALSDYTSLFQNNTDMMLNALTFNVGVMTEDGFDSLKSPRVKYCMAWQYDAEYDREDKVRANKLSEELLDTLADTLKEYDEELVEPQVDELKEKIESAGKEYAQLFMSSGKAPERSDLSTEVSPFVFGIIEDSFKAQMNGEEYEMPDGSAFEGEIDKSEIIGISDYVPQHLDQAICFAGTDMGGDKAAFVLFSYIVTGVLAFIFAVTISNTITAEASVIGTLRASGYSRGELTRHYLVLPVLVTLISAIIGNILGYTCFKSIMADMYYNSYSLPSYELLWSSEAFILTTVIPCVLMLVINLWVITSKMRLSPLQFLRRELKKNPRKKALKLNTKIPFITRFKLRIILRNLPSYLVMIFGIILGAAVIVFGDMFRTLFKDYADLIEESMICQYQYVLSDTVETGDPDAEKYSMTSFDFRHKDFVADEINVYGIEPESRYVSADVADGKVAVSSTVAKKYGLGSGDSITLDDPYSEDKSYTFTIDGVYEYSASLAIFISRETFTDTFGGADDDFTGYFSDVPLDDIADEDILMTITSDDYTKLSDQMENSLGGFLAFMKYFGVIMFILIMYILSKQVIERDMQSVSMCKILGFRDGEIGSLYIISTSVVVIIGLIAAVPAVHSLLKVGFEVYLYKAMTGYFPFIIQPSTYILMISIGIVSNALVAFVQMMKIKRISKGEALKNRE